MKRNGRDKKLNNAGFSLVELLIAVTILAIVVTPLMHMFVTSARMSSKAKERLRATTVAQDLVEGLKAYDIDSIKTQFGNPPDPTKEDIDTGFYIMDPTIIKGGVEELTARESDGKYYFSVKDIKMQGNEFDALISVDATDYEEMDTSTHTTGQSNGADNKEKAHNNRNIAYVSSINKDKDGEFSLNEDMDSQAYIAIYEAFRDKLEADGVSDADFVSYKKIKEKGISFEEREIKFTFVDGAITPEGVKQVDAKVDVTLTCRYKGTEEKVELKKDYPCSTFESGKFFFFYYPLYEAAKETIIYNNNATSMAIEERPLVLTIAKQIYNSDATDDERVLSDSELYAAELSYHATVDIKGGTKDYTKVRTNLGSNLANEKFIKAEDPNKVDLPGQVTFKFNSSNDTKLNIYTLSGVRSPKLGADGKDDPINEFIYDITVEIYPEGEADNDFADITKRIILLDGSMNN